MNNQAQIRRQAANGSIARQRREAAAGLAVLLIEKSDMLDIAIESRNDDEVMRLVVEIAILQREYLPFIIMTLKYFAGSVKKLPGGFKLDRPVPHEI